MIRGTEVARDEQQAALILQVRDHFFRLMLVLSDAKVEVIPRNCTGIAGVAVTTNCLGERFSDYGAIQR